MKTSIPLQNFCTMPEVSKIIWLKVSKYPLLKLLVLTVLENVI